MSDQKHPRLYAEARKIAVNAAGGERAFQIASWTVKRALVAEAILHLLYVQDDELVSAATVRDMLNDLYGTLIDDESLLD